MKPKNYEVLMDIYMGVLNAPAIQFTTEDFGMCQITFSLLEDRITPYNLSNCIVRMVINGQQQDCTISDANNGKAEIVLLQSMFSEVGPVFAELQIYDATNQTMRLTTPTFKYTVRKSLMDDNTAQADPNYSILQNMILEVSSADEVAKQAKKTAESAMATANQAESKADQIMSNGDYAKEQGDYAKAEGDRLQGMLTLDGAPQTKFDFIKNQVVKDGLIEYVNKKITGAHVVNKLDISNDFTLVGCIRNYNKTTLWYVPNVGQMRLVVDAQSNKLTINGFEDRRILETDATPIIEFAMIKQGSRFTISINGIIAVTDLKYADEDIINKWNTNKFSFGYNSATLEVEYTCNNRALAQQEIQHIFSVINNTPSIKELHTTNAEGETSILKLASDEDHVEMASGRTLREEYMGVLKTMGKEFVSADGSSVTVNNGIEARVISAEIKGQTVKNYFDCTKNPYYNGRNFFSPGTGIGYDFSSPIDVSKKYVIGFKVVDAEEQNTNTKITQGSIQFRLNPFGNLTTTFKVGEFKFTPIFTTSGSNGNYIIPQNCKVKITDMMLIESTEYERVRGFFTGLSSTQAIISNNGQQYPFYASEEDKANKKVISLDGGITQETDDTLIISDDGSIMLVKNYVNQIIDGSRADLRFANYSEENKKIVFTKLNDGSRTGWAWAKCNVLDYNANAYSSNVAGYGYSPDTNGNTYFAMNSDLFETKDLEGIKKYLNTNPIQFSFVAKTPTITHIPKELVPAILTHNQTNILEVGGKVKASSFKVTLPVDKLAEIEARLQALESTTVDVVLNK